LAKGFEMVTALRSDYAPTGKVATFINFRGLIDLEMEHDEPVGTFLARVHDAESDLHEGGLDLDPMLITLFFLNGLSDKFQPIRQSFYIHGEKHGALSVDEIQAQCVAYELALGLEGDDGLPAASAATPAADPAAGNSPMYPPAKPPPYAAIRQVMTNAATQCPVCHRPHNFGKCHKYLEAGWLVKYSPDEAKAALAIARPGGGKPASQPAASASAFQPAANAVVTGMLAAPAPASTKPADPVPADVSGEAAEIAAAAAEVADEVSLTDDEPSLVESSGIMSQKEHVQRAPWTPWRPD